MPLPDLNAEGDLPPGVHRAKMEEVISRFGGERSARHRCTKNLKHIFELASSTGQLQRLVIFGSYVTAKQAPNDIDVVLVMNEEFHPDEAPIAARGSFDHSVAQRRYGASVFWIKPSMAIGESVDEFIAYWQHKRDDTLRGIVEVVR